MNSHTFTADGRAIATPSVSVWKDDNTEIRVGKFYRTGNDDTYVGVKVTVKF